MRERKRFERRTRRRIRIVGGNCGCRGVNLLVEWIRNHDHGRFGVILLFLLVIVVVGRGFGQNRIAAELPVDAEESGRRVQMLLGVGLLVNGLLGGRSVAGVGCWWITVKAGFGVGSILQLMGIILLLKWRRYFVRWGTSNDDPFTYLRRRVALIAKFSLQQWMSRRAFAASADLLILISYVENSAEEDKNDGEKAANNDPDVTGGVLLAAAFIVEEIRVVGMRRRSKIDIDVIRRNLLFRHFDRAFIVLLFDQVTKFFVCDLRFRGRIRRIEDIRGWGECVRIWKNIS